MRVAIVHYHLRRGGVTRVIETAVAALADNAETVVLGGEPYGGDALPAVTVVDGLGYRDTPDAPDDDGPALGQRMLAAAADSLGGPPDLWHIHNHSLGKNVIFPAALRWLLANGARVLLQVHDFAEDGRPANYRAQRAVVPDAAAFARALYPAAPQIHYATLNERDNTVLAGAGVPSERRHLLPNAVSVPAFAGRETARPFGEAHRYFLYPTRGIRRKNLGEMVLLAAAARAAAPDTAYGATLAPDNPVWRPVYDAWVACARQHRLPVAFGLGEHHDFAGLVRGAEAIVTTSVAEGFGLAYLEPFLFGKDITGRDLPEITRGFTARGISLDSLYTALPAALIAGEERAFRDALAAALPALYKAYDRPLPENAVRQAFDASRCEAGFDFGRLNEDIQRSVIARVAADGPEEALVKRLPRARPPEALRRNRDIVAEEFGPSRYGETLLAAYQRLLAAEPAEPDAHDADAVLAAFLDPARFNLLRS
ncbi:MAG: hypothetical protein JJU00_04700 [Opitutales bacterium]|nr:hypothetical protein [Opitutales bacterium]